MTPLVRGFYNARCPASPSLDDPMSAPAAEAVLMVTVSCPPERAEALAGQLVEARLAACVNIVPAVRSIYRWQGAVQADDESLLLIKTAESRFEALKAFVLDHHPYELPEVVAVKLSPAHRPYLAWVLENTL